MQLAIFIFLGGYYGMLVKGIYTLPNALTAFAYNVLSLFFIFQIYLFLLLLAAHIFNPLLKKVSGKAVAGASGLLCLGVVSFGFFQAQSFTVTNHEIEVKGLERPVTLMHIPDLHLGAQHGEDYLQEVIGAINSRTPDFVLYNGDFVDSNIALRPEIFALFKTVKSDQYFTTGNREFLYEHGTGP